MIKRIIGIVVTLGVIAVIVLTCLGSGTYKSLIFTQTPPTPKTAPAARPVAAPAPSADSTTVTSPVR